MMIFNQAARNRETEADAMRLRGIKWLKNVIYLIYSDAWPGITDADFQPTSDFSWRIRGRLLPYLARERQDATFAHGLHVRQEACVA